MRLDCRVALEVEGATPSFERRGAMRGICVLDSDLKSPTSSASYAPLCRQRIRSVNRPSSHARNQMEDVICLPNLRV